MLKRLMFLALDFTVVGSLCSLYAILSAVGAIPEFISTGIALGVSTVFFLLVVAILVLLLSQTHPDLDQDDGMRERMAATFAGICVICTLTSAIVVAISFAYTFRIVAR